MKSGQRRRNIENTQPVEEMSEELLDELDKKSARRIRFRRIWKKARWLLWLLVLVPIVYLVVQIFVILAPRIRTEVALQNTMTDKISVVGEVVLESTPVTGSSNGYIYYTVPTGQRVAAGAEVACIFATEADVEAMDRLVAIEKELELLNEAETAGSGGSDLDLLMSQTQSGLYGILEAVENGNYSGLDDARNQLTLADNKTQKITGEVSSFSARITSLTQQKEYYEQQAVPVGVVTAPIAGYFVPSQQFDRIPLTTEDMAEMTPARLQDALGRTPTYYASDVAGHIVSDYKWHFYTTVDLRSAEKFIVGSKSLSLAFPDASDTTIPVTVAGVTNDDDAGIAMIELSCAYIGPEILSLRTENAEIVFGEIKGLRIEKNALRLVDEVNEDGSVTTYQGVYVQLGNMVYFKKVEILIEDEFYMLVSDTVTTGVNEVQLYDKVVVDAGGTELYDRKIL